VPDTAEIRDLTLWQKAKQKFALSLINSAREPFPKNGESRAF